LRFVPSGDLGRPLSPAEFAARYCECSFCIGAFESNEHPLDLLLEDHEIKIGNATRKTPTSRAVGANSWHFLLSRRLEVESFDRYAAMDVVRRDIERAEELSGRGATERLRRLMDDLRTA
jgi:hypothetical protein